MSPVAQAVLAVLVSDQSQDPSQGSRGYYIKLLLAGGKLDLSMPQPDIQVLTRSSTEHPWHQAWGASELVPLASL